MDVEQSMNAHELKHMESVGQVDYQRLSALNTSSGNMPDHYKHSQEYADVALEELQYEKH